jgi:hypothetical protein
LTAVCGRPRPPQDGFAVANLPISAPSPKQSPDPLAQKSPRSRGRDCQHPEEVQVNGASPGCRDIDGRPERVSERERANQPRLPGASPQHCLVIPPVKVRDRQGAIASTRGGCAPQSTIRAIGGIRGLSSRNCSTVAVKRRGRSPVRARVSNASTHHDASICFLITGANAI